MPLNRFPWADATIVEFDPPYRLVEAGRAGKFNRIKVTTEYRLYEGAGDTTRIELTSETEPALISDKLLERLGARGWVKRQNPRGPPGAAGAPHGAGAPGPAAPSAPCP